MDLDQILETWRSQDAAPLYAVNEDSLRQALHNQAAGVRRLQRFHRRVRWFYWIFGTGMAVFAGFWIAISVTNGWPVIYGIASGASIALFVLGIGAMWLSRGRQEEPARNFANSLQDEVRRSLVLVNDQLSLTRHWTIFMLGAASVIAGTMLFAWTVRSSQGVTDSSFGGNWPWKVLLVGFFVWASFKERDKMRQAKPKLELRQRRLRELLATIEARE